MVKMEQDKIHKVITNMCDPVDKNYMLRFTSRAKLFLVNLFEGKKIDAIDLHCILLRLAHVCGWFRKREKYINLKDIVVYFMGVTTPCIMSEDVKKIALTFTPSNDNEFFEVEDMRRIIDNM